MKFLCAILLGFLFASLPVMALCPSGAVTELAVEEGERVIVVLKDGSEVIGEVIEESEEKISVKSVFGVTSIEMSRVESIIRGAEVSRREFEQRQKRAIRRGSAAGWHSLGRWALE